MSKQKKAAFVLCLMAAAAAIFYIVYYFASLQRQQAAYSEVQSIAAQVQATPAASEAVSETPPPDIPVDFAALQAQYPDIYAWIEIPDTDVNYPILQHPTDNTYYLNYNLDGTKGYPGCIFTENWNAKDFSNFNTILYGHNMKDGSMFGGLKKYRDEDYLAQHRDIIIYTPTEKRTYRIFAAVVYSDTYIPTTFDENTLDGRAAFLDSLQNSRSLNSRVLDDVAVDTSSEILTLSTCIGGQPNNRYLIEAVYVGEE